MDQVKCRWGGGAQVSTEHQLRQALTLVALALPSGLMTLVKARLMSLTVLGVAAAMEEMTGSELPCGPSKGDPSEPLCKAVAHSERRVGARIS